MCCCVRGKASTAPRRAGHRRGEDPSCDGTRRRPAPPSRSQSGEGGWFVTERVICPSGRPERLVELRTRAELPRGTDVSMPETSAGPGVPARSQHQARTWSRTGLGPGGGLADSDVDDATSGRGRRRRAIHLLAGGNAAAARLVRRSAAGNPEAVDLGNNRRRLDAFTAAALTDYLDRRPAADQDHRPLRPGRSALHRPMPRPRLCRIAVLDRVKEGVTVSA